MALPAIVFDDDANDLWATTVGRLVGLNVEVTLVGEKPFDAEIIAVYGLESSVSVVVQPMSRDLSEPVGERRTLNAGDFTRIYIY